MEKAESFNHDDKGVDELMQPEERRVRINKKLMLTI